MLTQTKGRGGQCWPETKGRGRHRHQTKGTEGAAGGPEEREKGWEEILGSEFPYLSLIEVLMYLANNTRPSIVFAVNLLAGHSAAPTRRHGTGGKQIHRYLNSTKDLGLFFQKN
jgi:hypothetical protein